MKRILTVLLLSLALLLPPAEGRADFPERTLTILCPFGAGGGTDRMVRALAVELEELLGQTVLVENKTGREGSAGFAAGARAEPDGYTLTCTTFELATLHWLGVKEAPAWRDFAPIALFNTEPALLAVDGKSSWNLTDLMDRIHDQPGKVTFSGTVRGGIWDLGRALLLHAAGLEPQDAVWVPSLGSVSALPSLFGGYVDAVICGVSELRPWVHEGKVCPLLLLAKGRDPDLPGVPTAIDVGYNIACETWRGLSAPAGTPKEVLQCLNQAVKTACSSNRFVTFMKKNGWNIVYEAPEAYRERMERTDRDCRSALALAGYLKTAPVPVSADAGADSPAPFQEPTKKDGRQADINI